MWKLDAQNLEVHPYQLVFLKSIQKGIFNIEMMNRPPMYNNKREKKTNCSGLMNSLNGH